MAARFTTQSVVFLTAFILSAMPFSMMVSAQECTPADITLSSQVEVSGNQRNQRGWDQRVGPLHLFELAGNILYTVLYQPLKGRFCYSNCCFRPKKG
jgi:hypothetical protein